MSDIQPRVPSQALSLYIYDEGHPFLDYILCYSSEMGWLINEGKTVTSNILKISPTGTWLSESCYLFIGPTNNIEEMTSLFLAEDYSSIPDSVEIPQNLLSSPEYYFGIKLSAADNPLISEAIPNSAQVITSKTIQITCSTPSSQIYYTLDGSTPTKNSILYSEEFKVSSPFIIKAIGIKEGYISSDIVTEETPKLPTPVIISTDFTSMDKYCDVYVEGFDSLTSDNFMFSAGVTIEGEYGGPQVVTNNGGGNYNILITSAGYSLPVTMYITLPGYIDSDIVTVIE